MGRDFHVMASLNDSLFDGLEWGGDAGSGVSEETGIARKGRKALVRRAVCQVLRLRLAPDAKLRSG
jgi:hypothetical protein